MSIHTLWSEGLPVQIHALCSIRSWAQVRSMCLVRNVVPVLWTGGLLVQTYNRTESWGRHGVVHNTHPLLVLATAVLYYCEVSTRPEVRCTRCGWARG